MIFSSSNNDEYYTPPYAVEPILPYVAKYNTVWCPFDTEDSWYVKLLIEFGHKVIYTHINSGSDFFTCEVPECDCIVSNPPYSVKTEVLQRLFEIGKPFAMLVGVAGLFESKRRFSLFRDNRFEIMYLSKRVAFFQSYADQKPSVNPPFSSVYICHNVLPNQIEFKEITR